jgi:hypothetical protein
VSVGRTLINMTWTWKMMTPHEHGHGCYNYYRTHALYSQPREREDTTPFCIAAAVVIAAVSHCRHCHHQAVCAWIHLRVLLPSGNTTKQLSRSQSQPLALAHCSEKGIRLAEKKQVGPCIPAGIQL